MSKKKEWILFLIIMSLVVLVLIQILIVYKAKYNKALRLAEKRVEELKNFEKNLNDHLSKKVVSMEINNLLIQNTINAQKMENIFKEALEYGLNKNNNSYKDNNYDDYYDISFMEMDDRNRNFFNDNNNFENNNNEITFVRSFLPYCSLIPNNLVGSLNLSMDKLMNSTKDELFQDLNFEIKNGGHWKPNNCTSRHKVAIIIPFRDREHHLNVLLSLLHTILPRQQLDYRIYVVEQTGNDTFNKAQLMNAGFLIASEQHDFHCYIFHDVDLLPEDDRNLYSCSNQPKHLSVAVDEMNYKLAYPELVGGVLNMRKEHFLQVNGYSNLYWGWGAEDDDMAYRILYNGLRITRPPYNVAKYKMIKHTKQKPSDFSKRAKLLYTGLRRFQIDGLNTVSHNISSISNTPYYTKVMVDINKMFL